MITALIIDDEAHNINVLKTLLNKHCRYVNVIGDSNNVSDAFSKIMTLQPQLVFLDIKMPGKNGFDLLKMFDKINFEVIFVSAFNEYAITAFDFNALGYILKPIDYSKLIKVLDKAIIKISSNEENNNVLHFIKTLEEKNDIINKISFHHNEKVVFVNICDVISVEANVGTCEVKLIDGSRYNSTRELKLFENILEKAGNFIRINRSVVINVNFIVSYSKGEVCNLEMQNGIFFEVSRRKKAEVLGKMKL